ncbi:hypothetical protein C1E24_06555 [Pseudoalteromonas phenolica]|uniref:Thioredoxin domain-containing protein n=1 Tax=Pseudoalteromonas phenolica TaxID=161398 RepID=A0A5R9Q424_9GAMM|nr:thioredoxin family protein [Pseudoalteromonas phenolica]TLX47893.1 hypothetical protein C1E24_06555 [Pseudoalteromonas phenolica]
MKYFTLLILLFANTALAKNYDITFPDKVKTSLGRGAPQVYIFDKNQTLIYKVKRQDDNLLSKFKLKTPLADSDTLKQELEFLMKEPLIFNGDGFTLIAVLLDIGGKCPPCKAQMDVINKIQRKFKDRLTVHTLTVIQSNFAPEDLPERYRPKLIGKQKTKEK